MKRRLSRIWRVVLPVVALLSLTALSACGRKGPPVPPDRPPLPKVSTLSGRLEGDTVTLNWQAEGADKGVRGYVVLRADKSLADPDCKGCPMVFEKVGEPGVGRDTETVLFKDAVPDGAVYIYQVQPVGAAGDRGPGSNQVEIDRSMP